MASLALVGGTASATPEPLPLVGPNPVAEFAERLQSAISQLQQQKCEAATWRGLIDDPVLPKVASRLRSYAYSGAAICVGGADARQWVRKSTEEPDAPPNAWGLRFAIDVDLKDTSDALHALEVTAERSGWTAVETYNDLALFRFRRLLEPDAGAGRRLLRLLDRVGWKPSGLIASPSALWKDLAQFDLEDGKAADATRVAKRITAPAVLFSMRLDRRFDPLVKADPNAFDVEKAAVATLERHRAQYADHPDQGEIAYEIIEDLRLLNRPEEALIFADQTLAKADVKDERGQDYHHWIEDRRAMVLADLGRFDEALAIEQKAASSAEHGAPNVSQRINLAGLLSMAGKSEDALQMLAPFGNGLTASPYGDMWVATERLCAANALGRDAVAKMALAFTAVHAADNKGARLKAQLCANDLAGARQTVVGWLENPADRQYALLQLCRFAPGAPPPPFQAELIRRFETVRTDPAVIAAVERVGRTETSRLAGGIWTDVL